MLPCLEQVSNMQFLINHCTIIPHSMLTVVLSTAHIKYIQYTILPTSSKRSSRELAPDARRLLTSLSRRWSWATSAWWRRYSNHNNNICITDKQRALANIAIATMASISTPIKLSHWCWKKPNFWPKKAKNVSQWAMSFLTLFYPMDILSPLWLQRYTIIMRDRCCPDLDLLGTTTMPFACLVDFLIDYCQYSMQRHSWSEMVESTTTPRLCSVIYTDWVLQRIKFHLAVLVYHCRKYTAPDYLSRDLQWAADSDSRRRLLSLSTHKLIVPWTRLKTSVIALRVWNERTPAYRCQHFITSSFQEIIKNIFV